jgi:hypothetical protein
MGMVSQKAVYKECGIITKELELIKKAFKAQENCGLMKRLSKKRKMEELMSSSKPLPTLVQSAPS